MSAAILVVDDMRLIREPIAAALRLAGFEAACAANGREAMALIAADRPALVLLDLDMPGMHGLEVLRQLREAPGPDTPRVIVLTASQDRRSVIRAKELGVRHFLVKSAFSLEELLSRVRSTLEEPQHTPECSPAAPGPAAPDSGGVLHEQQRAASAGPSRAATVHAPVEAAAAVRDLRPIMTRSEVIDSIKCCEDLKGLSPTVSRVLTMASNESCSLEAIAKAISQDQAMSLKMLRLANSSIYSRGDRVDTLYKAVLRIGTANIHQAVLNIGVVERFNSLAFQEHLNTAQFWEHSIACGLIATELANATSPQDADSAFTCGLLHDLGRAIYAEALGERYVTVIQTARDLGAPLELVESRMLLLNHADIMERLLGLWKFPRPLVEPIVLHHSSAAAPRGVPTARAPQVLRLALADRLAHALLLGNSGNEILYPTADLCHALGIDPEVISGIEQILPQQTDDTKFALLSSSNGAAWPRRRDELRELLHAPLRPLYVSASPATDAFRICCDVLAGPGADGTANVLIAHVESANEQRSIAEKITAADEAAGAGTLPLLVLSPPGTPPLPHRLTATRPHRLLLTPTPVSRLIATINELVQPQGAQRAA